MFNVCFSQANWYGYLKANIKMVISRQTLNKPSKTKNKRQKNKHLHTKKQATHSLYIHTHTHTHTNAHTHTHICNLCTNTHTRTCALTCMATSARPHMRKNTHARASTYTHICTLSLSLSFSLSLSLSLSIRYKPLRWQSGSHGHACRQVKKTPETHDQMDSEVDRKHTAENSQNGVGRGNCWRGGFTYVT